MKIVIDLDGWSPGAGAHALDLFERNLPIRGYFFMSDTKLLASVLVQLHAADEKATDVGADLDVILPHGLAMKHGIVAHHLVDLKGRNFAAPGDFVDQLRRDGADLVLRV